MGIVIQSKTVYWCPSCKRATESTNKQPCTICGGDLEEAGFINDLDE